MKRIFFLLALALAAGFCAFVWTGSRPIAAAPHATLLEAMPELNWLRKELSLNTLQFEKVRELHVAYLPECEAMCEQIAEAHKRLAMASAGQTSVTAELKAAIHDHARIHAECQEKMLAHLYRTAAVLDHTQAQRYLELMLPYALDFSHSEHGKTH